MCVCVYIIQYAHTNRKETHVCVWIINSPTCACACVCLCAHMQFLFLCAGYLVVSSVSVSRSVLFLLLSLHGAVCGCVMCVGRVVISHRITQAQDAGLSSLEQYIHARARARTHTHTHTQTFMCGCVCEGMCQCGRAKRASSKATRLFLMKQSKQHHHQSDCKADFLQNLLPPSRGTYSLQCMSVVS